MSFMKMFITTVPKRALRELKDIRSSVENISKRNTGSKLVLKYLQEVQRICDEVIQFINEKKDESGSESTTNTDNWKETKTLCETLIQKLNSNSVNKQELDELHKSIIRRITDLEEYLGIGSVDSVLIRQLEELNTRAEKDEYVHNATNLSQKKDIAPLLKDISKSLNKKYNQSGDYYYKIRSEIFKYASIINPNSPNRDTIMEGMKIHYLENKEKRKRIYNETIGKIPEIINRVKGL